MIKSLAYKRKYCFFKSLSSPLPPLFHSLTQLVLPTPQPRAPFSIHQEQRIAVSLQERENKPQTSTIMTDRYGYYETQINGTDTSLPIECKVGNTNQTISAPDSTPRTAKTGDSIDIKCNTKKRNTVVIYHHLPYTLPPFKSTFFSSLFLWREARTRAIDLIVDCWARVSRFAW